MPQKLVGHVMQMLMNKGLKTKRYMDIISYASDESFCFNTVQLLKCELLAFVHIISIDN